MHDDPKKTDAQATRDGPGPLAEPQPAGRDRRVVRTVDLTDEDIAAIEASEMAPGYEHLNAEFDES